MNNHTKNLKKKTRCTVYTVLFDWETSVPLQWRIVQKVTTQ